MKLNTLKYSLLLLIFTSTAAIAQQVDKTYLDADLSVEARVENLMSQMTLEEKVYQMCQYVGLEHMKAAEAKISPEELDKNDTLGFYPGMLSDDVAKLAEQGKIGSFLHVVTPDEANLLQKLALKSRLQIPLLIGIDAIHGNGLVSGSTIYPSPATLPVLVTATFTII